MNSLLGLLFATGFVVSVALEVLPDANEMLRQLQWSKGVQPCDVELQVGDMFATPVNGLGTMMGAGTRLFLIGDEVVRELCERGSPGLCCSDAKPCVGQPSFMSQGQRWKLSMERHGWSALQKFPLRARDHTPSPSFAYYLRPDAPSDISGVQGAVDMLSEFLAAVGASNRDVMVVGPMAAHSLPVLNNYTQKLLKAVVNPFPGRVVLLGFSPDHPATATGGACAASPLPGEADPPVNGFRSALFVYNVWKHLTNMRAKLVDVSEMLRDMPSCHRQSLLATCTSWKDPVVSVISQLVLNALQSIH